MVRRWTVGQDPVDARYAQTDFALGFMTGLRVRGFGRELPDDSFGHSGFLGNSFAVAVPSLAFVLVCIVPVVPASAQGLGREWRAELIDALVPKAR
jgi:hypothetical protein